MILEVFCVYIPDTREVYIIGADVAIRPHKPLLILYSSGKNTTITVIPDIDMPRIFQGCVEFAQKYREVLPGSEYSQLVPNRIRSGSIDGHSVPNSKIAALLSGMVNIVVDPNAMKNHLEINLARELINYKNKNPN